MSTLTLILYAGAALLYGAHFIRRDAQSGRAATLTLLAAVLSHAFVLGMHTVTVGHVPLVGGGEAVSAFVWMLALTYLYVEVTTNERAMGLFIALPIALLYIIPLTSPDPIERPALLDSPFFAVHTISALCAYASFALACVVSVTYVLLFRELKHKQPGLFYARLPPLRSLDLMNIRAVSVGLIFLTVSVIVGMIWVGHARATSPDDPRVQAMSILDPKIFLALVSWLLYAFQLYARRVIGWGGQRAAWLSTIGFGSVLANLLAVTYLLHNASHSFH